LGRHINAIGSGSSRKDLDGPLPTPTRHDGQRRGKLRSDTQSEMHLSSLEWVVKKRALLPTPTAFDATGNVKQKPATDRGWMGSLRQQEARLRRWETPSKADAHPRAYNRTGPYTGPHPQKHLQAQAFERSSELDSATGKLNPTWVEWLMGWPMQWTDLPPLETDKFQQWCALHGRCWPDARGIQAEEPPAANGEARRG
jgi:hypothetical protein